MNAKKIVNLTKFLLAGALVLGMTACSSDDDITKGGNENNVNTYLTVSLTGNSLQRTTQNGHTNAGSPEESTISSLKVILVSGSSVSNIIEVNSDSLITTSETGSTVETAGKETKPIKVATGTYRVYVIANPSNNFTVTKGTSETDLRKTISSKLATSDYATNNKFLMTNATNYKDDYTEAKEVTVSASNTESNPAKTDPIHLDRLAAKILISNTTHTFNTVNGKSFSLIHYNTTTGNLENQQIDINLVSYSLINTYNKANLYQQWDGTSAAGFTEELLTPNYSTSYDYFKNHTNDFGNQKDVFSTRTAAASNKIAGFSELTDNRNVSTPIGTASYCLENNPWNTILNGTKYTKYDNQVTGVLFKAQAVKAGTTTAQTFYSYNGKYYLELADIQKEYPEVFAKYFNGTSVVPSEKTAAGDQLNEAKDVLNHPNNTGANDIRVRYGIKVYESGNMYYTYYIKDKNYLEHHDAVGTLSASNDNYYAIMRNSIYSLNVSSLVRIGDDIPFGWTPTPVSSSDTQYPIDSDEAYMTVELVVNQWVLNTYDIPLQ